MAAQAGGNTSNRRRRKQRIQNYYKTTSDGGTTNPPNTSSSSSVTNTQAATTTTPNFIRINTDLPAPLLPYDLVKSVKLIDISKPNENDEDTNAAAADNAVSAASSSSSSTLRVEIGLVDNTNTGTTTDAAAVDCLVDAAGAAAAVDCLVVAATTTPAPAAGTGTGTTLLIDPRDLHQTSDFDLWMALRKHVVDVSASQLSVVLGTNYFTSREKLLHDKIRNNQQQRDTNSSDSSNSGSGSSPADAQGRILIGTEQENMPPSSSRSNSKACDWGIKMEPIAFAQYKGIMETTKNQSKNDADADADDTNNTDDNDADDDRTNCVVETGMYLLQHTDPITKRKYTFGASPDGLVTEYPSKNKNTDSSTTGLLEIKSLWGYRNKGSLPEYNNCPNRFYDQIQGQLAVCDKAWCDLMMFIPPGGGATDGNGGRTTKRKGTSNKKKRKQKKKQQQTNHLARKTKGRNYCIVRVKRNREYWNETLLPALIEFCNDVDTGSTSTSASSTIADSGVSQ